jgi:hypothetical protein
MASHPGNRGQPNGRHDLLVSPILPGLVQNGIPVVHVLDVESCDFNRAHNYSLLFNLGFVFLMTACVTYCIEKPSETVGEEAAKKSCQFIEIKSSAR